MRRVSAFILALTDNITSDLRDSVDAEKLQDQVEKELHQQVLTGVVTAIAEYKQAIDWYSSDTTKQAIAQRKMLRTFDNARELFEVADQIRGAITAGPGLQIHPAGTAPEANDGLSESELGLTQDMGYMQDRS